MITQQMRQAAIQAIAAKQLISHALTTHEEEVFATTLDRIHKTTVLTLPLERTLKLAHELATFPIGKFLLAHRGLNGYWTSDAVLTTRLPPHTPSLETWLRLKAPAAKAIRERFHISQREAAQLLRDNTTLASIPCGLMDDLLRLECGNFKNINFIGVDLDEEALTLALGNAQNLGYEDQLSLILQDAWELEMDQEADVIISTGLTAYEQDHSRNLALFKRFHRALKPGGTLITSFWTPPPSQGNLCPWRNYDVEDVMLQKAIFSDILNARWLSYLTEEEATGILANAGFKVERVIHDSQSMCPTVTAKRV